MRRKIEAILAIVLKCFFIYDLLHLIIIKPIEGLLYRRLSSSLIISSGNTLHMSFNNSELISLRSKTNSVQKLLTIKRSFVSGLEKLDFSNDYNYYTYINAVFYSVLVGDKELENQGIISLVISSKEKNQTETKLLLIKSTDVWKQLLSKNRRKFLKFLFRREKILQIEFKKP